MLLFIARHAWAGHFGDPGWDDDSLRELTADGVRRYTRVVEALAQRGFAPERIATSPYARCRQTAELIAEHTPAAPPIDELESLAPGADLQALVEWTTQHAAGDACWVGHNPDVEWLVEALVGDPSAAVRFAKGSVAALRFDGAVEPSGAELLWHATAKSLGL